MIEDVAKEIRTAFQTYLPAALNAQDTEYAAADAAEFGYALVLADVVTYRLEESDEVQLQELPALFILPRGVEEEPTLTQLTFLNHVIDLVLVIAGTKPEELARRLWRSHDAMRKVLSQYVEGTGVSETDAFQIDLRGFQFSPTFELAGGGLRKVVTQNIAAKEWENRP